MSDSRETTVLSSSCLFATLHWKKRRGLVTPKKIAEYFWGRLRSTFSQPLEYVLVGRESYTKDAENNGGTHLHVLVVFQSSCVMTFARLDECFFVKGHYVRGDASDVLI